MSGRRKPQLTEKEQQENTLLKLQNELETKKRMYNGYIEKANQLAPQIEVLDKEVEYLTLKIQKEEINKLYKYCSKNNLTADDVIELIGGEKLEKVENIEEEKIIQGN